MSSGRRPRVGNLSTDRECVVYDGSDFRSLMVRAGAERDRVESASTPWGWVAGGTLVAGLVLLTIGRTLRRRWGSVLAAR